MEGLLAHWNYRIIRTRKKMGHPATGGEFEQVSYALHEVYHDDEGRPNGFTEDLARFGGETVQEIVEALALALHDAIRRPVIERADIEK